MQGLYHLLEFFGSRQNLVAGVNLQTCAGGRDVQGLSSRVVWVFGDQGESVRKSDDARICCERGLTSA